MATPVRDRTDAIAAAADEVVQAAPPGVPGVVAGVTDHAGTLYLGAAGVRDLETRDEMTTDSVFAIFSTTKAITGLTVLQLVEEGRLDLDAPASEYVPALGEVMRFSWCR